MQAKRALDASFRVNCSAGDASSDRHHEEEHTDEVCDTEEAEFWALIHGIAVSTAENPLAIARCLLETAREMVMHAPATFSKKAELNTAGDSILIPLTCAIANLGVLRFRLTP